MPDLILASQSPFRAMLLKNAGVPFSAIRAGVDERAIDSVLEARGATPIEIALELARAKALAVSMQRPDALVIGSDQTLSLADRVFHKPQDMEGARQHLKALAGRTHALNSAIALAQGGSVIWDHVSVARLTMRTLDDGFIRRHLERVGDKALTSVGAYQYEGEGVQLFEAIDGDYFTIVGLPLLPLLAQLRLKGVIDG